VEAGLVAADWTLSPTAATLATTTVTTSGFESAVLTSINLSGADYSAALLGTSQETLVYEWDDDWWLTFSSPWTICCCTRPSGEVV
jgi:hypothetical protein